MLAGATDLQLEVIDEQVVSGTGGIHPDAKVGVASRGRLGKVNLVESGIAVVEVALCLLIALSRVSSSVQHRSNWPSCSQVKHDKPSAQYST